MSCVGHTKIAIAVVFAMAATSSPSEAGILRPLKRLCRLPVNVVARASTYTSYRIGHEAPIMLNLIAQRSLRQWGWISPGAARYFYRRHIEMFGNTTTRARFKYPHDAIEVSSQGVGELSRFVSELQMRGLTTQYLYSGATSKYALASFLPLHNRIFFSDYEFVSGVVLPPSHHEAVHAEIHTETVRGKPSFLAGHVLSRRHVEDAVENNGEILIPIEEHWAYPVGMRAGAAFVEDLQHFDPLRAFVVVMFADAHHFLRDYLQRTLPVVEQLDDLGDKREVELSKEPPHVHYAGFFGLPKAALKVRHVPDVRYLYIRGETEQDDFLRAVFPVTSDIQPTDDVLRQESHNLLGQTRRFLLQLEPVVAATRPLADELDKIDVNKPDEPLILRTFANDVVEAGTSIYEAAASVVDRGHLHL